ncbi:Nramp family divalent metal transporter [Calidifontibacter terrae]
MLQKVRQPTGVRTLIPACLAAVAYIDPGNFGVNIAAGAQFGYSLVWVVIAASATASVVQYLAAKLGLATGRSLAENCRERYARPMRLLLWLMTELVVVMTDLAELVGGAFALNLLFGLPLVVGALLVGAFSFLVLAVRVHGHDGFEGVILALLGTVVAAVLWQMLIAGVDVHRLFTSIAPRPMEPSAALLAVGIVGATVMPHALHFHSAVSRPDATDARLPSVPSLAPRSMTGLRRSVIVAMSMAGIANVAIVIAAATLPAAAAESLPAAYQGFEDVAGPMAATLLGVALLASGLSSTVVGVYTGQVVMQGFLQRSVSIWLRRAVSLVPPLLLLGFGLDATRALVFSQVVLSFALPTSLVPLVLLTRQRSVMGTQVNRRVTTVFATVATTSIIGLDAYLLVGLI